MAEWLVDAGALLLALGTMGFMLWTTRLRVPEHTPDSQTLRCAQPDPTNQVPECCREGVHSPFWQHGYSCRYCGKEPLFDAEAPTVPDHTWRPGE